MTISSGTLLRASLVVMDVDGKASNPLFDGSKDSAKPIASRYSVRRSHDVLISFRPTVLKLHGEMSVRARILGSPPTEISVENYTAVNDKELKEDKKVLFLDNLDLFRDKPYQEFVDHINELQQAATDYTASLAMDLELVLSTLYKKQSVEDWYEEGPLPSTLDARPSPAVVDAAVARLRHWLGDETTKKRQLVLDCLGVVQSDINNVLLKSKLAAQIDERKLDLARRVALSLMRDLHRFRAEIANAPPFQATVLDSCAAATTTYQVQQAIEVTRNKGEKVKLEPGLYIRAIGKSIVWPPQLQDYTIADLTTLLKLGASTDCFASIIPQAIGPLGLQLNQAQKLRDQIQKGEGGKNGSLLLQVEAIKEHLSEGMGARLAEDIRDARVRLSALPLKHDDRVEIIVKVSRKAVSLHDGEKESTVDVEERIVIRVVDEWFFISAGPQFALVKRFSDVRTATGTEQPANFKPAVGVNLAARFRPGTSKYWDWFLPSVGISAHLVDFDPSASAQLEVGVGPSVGWLDEHVHAGVGWNLSIYERRAYWWISLDFLRTFDTFKGLFGGGG